MTNRLLSLACSTALLPLAALVPTGVSAAPRDGAAAEQRRDHRGHDREGLRRHDREDRRRHDRHGRHGHDDDRDVDPDGARDTDNSTIIVSGQRHRPSYTAPSGIGSKVKTNPRELPQSVAVITRQRLEDQNIRTSTEALAQVPGFNSTSKEGFFTLRGFSTGTAVDGAPSAAIAGRTDVDVEVFEQIEVLKGAAGLLQGTGSPGGVVNYVFKKPTSRFAASAKLGGGSYDAYYGGVDIGGPITADRSLRARGVAFYDDRDSYMRPEYRRRLTMYGTVQYDLTPRTTASAGYFRQKNKTNVGFRQGLPTYSDGTLLDVSPRTSLSQDWGRWDMTSTSWLADIEHRFDGDWIAKLAWRRGRTALPAIIPYAGGSARGSACAQVPGFGALLTAPYIGVQKGVAGGTLRCMNTGYYNDESGTNSLDGWVAGKVTLFGQDQKLLLGYNKREELFSRSFGQASAADDFVNDVLNPNPHVRDRPFTTTPPQGPRSITTDEGIYGRVTLSPVAWLKFPVGGRVSWAKDGSGRQVADGQFTPYFGAVADLTKQISAYASYTEIFTPSSATARVYRPDAPAPDFGDIPPPVTGSQYEGGIKAALFGGRLDVAAAYFRIVRKNATSADPDRPVIGSISYVLLTGETTTKGFEAQVNGQILPNMSLGLAYSYTDATVTKDFLNSGGIRDAGYIGQTVAAVPKHALNLWTNYRFVTGTLQGASLGGGVRAQSRQQGALVCRTSILTANAARCPQPRIVGPGYATVSLRAGYEFDRHFDLALNIDNLFDKRYWEQVATRTNGNYMGSPFTAMVTLRARY